MNLELLQLPFISQTVQVTFLILFMAIVVRQVGRRRAHLAYWLWMVVVIKCLLPPVWTSPTGVFSWLAASYAPAASAPLIDSSDNVGLSKALVDPQHDLASSLPAKFVATKEVREKPQQDNASIADMPARVSSIVSGSVIESGLICVWIVGGVVSALLLAWRWQGFRRTIRRHGVETDEVLQAEYEAAMEDILMVAAGSGRFHAPQLLVVDADLGPATFGCWRPTIVFPKQLMDESTAAQRRIVLAHELTHVRRRDTWFAWLQTISVCVWWFHPLVWWMNRQVVVWREAACDEQVIARLGVSAKSYATTLLRVLESRLQPALAFPIGMANVPATEERIVRIADRKTFEDRMSIWNWIVIGLVLAVFLPGAAATLADGTSDVDEPKVAQAEAAQAEAAEDPLGIVVFPALTDDDKRKLAEFEVDIHGTAMGASALANADIHLVRRRANQPPTVTSVKTDAKGRFHFLKQKLNIDAAIPHLSESVALVGRSADGTHAWRSYRWQPTEEGLALREVGVNDSGTFISFRTSSHPRPPSRQELTLSFPVVAKSMSGTAQDETGKPLNNVEVMIESRTKDLQNNKLPNLHC